MGQRVDARDVLDTNGRVKAPFRALEIGRFRRTGPNGWDDFELVRREGGVVDALAGVPVQVEEFDAELRLRKDGQVLLVRWLPTPGEEARLAGATATAVRAWFLDHYVAPFDEAPGMGAAAVIARTLDDDD